MPTSPLNSGQVRIAGTGGLWKAPLGTTLPADSVAAWGTGFVNLGYADDGFGMKQDLKTKEITGWQTLEVLRLVPLSLTRHFSFLLKQSNKDTLGLAWGGATITAGTGGAYTLVIPDAAALTGFIIGIDWSDGALTQRIIIQNAALVTLPEIKFIRTDGIDYAMEVQALAPADGTKSVLVYGVDIAVAGA